MQITLMGDRGLKVFLRMNYPLKTVDARTESFGIHTANTEFLVNLIRYSRKIEEFGLVVTDPEEEKALKELFPERKINGHVFQGEDELIKVLQYYDIFFVAGYGIYDILQCEEFFNQGLSVVGLTHSLHMEEIARSIKRAAEICSEKDVLICTSSAGRSSIERILQAFSSRLRLEIIPLGLDIDRYCPVNDEVKKELRLKFDLPEEAIIFLSLGRLSPDEKMELTSFLKAFSELAKLSDSCRVPFLLIVGKEHSKGYINILLDLANKFKIKDRVKIITDYEACDIPLYYGAADIFVSLSDNIQETFGLTVVEAMSSGLPVIVSDWNGYRETVVDRRTGFLIPTYWADSGIEWHKRFQLAQSVAIDMDRLVECMQDLLENEEQRRAMGLASRHHVESSFAWEKVINRYDMLFKQLASGKRKREKRDIKKGSPSSEPALSPADVFKSYPTEFVTEEFCIRLKDIDGFTAYSDVVQIVDVKIVNHIANLIAKGMTRVGDITQEILQELGLPAQKTLFQIMVMMKYGVFAPAR